MPTQLFITKDNQTVEYWDLNMGELVVFCEDVIEQNNLADYPKEDVFPILKSVANRYHITSECDWTKAFSIAWEYRHNPRPKVIDCHTKQRRKPNDIYY